MARFVVLSYFEPEDVPTLLREARRVPESIPVYVGSYAPNGDVAQQVAGLPNGRYAPMFALQEPYYREQRRVPPEQADGLDPRFAGTVPPLSWLGSTSLRVSWGVELGSRYRDQIGQTQDAGFVVDSWQFDEIVPSAAREGGAPLREFLRGVFRGLVFGRPELDDPTVQGSFGLPTRRWLWRGSPSRPS